MWARPAFLSCPQSGSGMWAPGRSPQMGNMQSIADPSPGGELRAGAVVRVGQHKFRVTQHIGSGSFSSVWAATRMDGTGGEVAIKETRCTSQDALADAEREGRILQQVCSTSSRIPEHIAFERFQSSPSTTTVRLAMAKVSGDSLGAFLTRWKPIHRTPSASPQVVATQLGEACLWTRELLMQLLPAFEALESVALHRDVNTHNILVSAEGGGAFQPEFGLIDFGLAIETQTWSSMLSQLPVVGDCRYWPESAWYAFAAGPEIANHPRLLTEYRTQLDLHGLGVTALQMFTEMLPEAVGGAKAVVPEEIRSLKRAWEQYWHDACRFWEPLFRAFETQADWQQLRRNYLSNKVHKVIGQDLWNLKHAVRKVCDACGRADAGSPLSGNATLFSALFKLICEGSAVDGDGADFTTWQTTSSVLNTAPRSGSKSTTTCMGGSTTTSVPSFIPAVVSLSKSASVSSISPMVLNAPARGPPSYTTQPGPSISRFAFVTDIERHM